MMSGKFPRSFYAEDTPGSVFIRALEPIEGIELVNNPPASWGVIYFLNAIPEERFCLEKFGDALSPTFPKNWDKRKMRCE